MSGVELVDCTDRGDGREPEWAGRNGEVTRERSPTAHRLTEDEGRLMLSPKPNCSGGQR